MYMYQYYVVKNSFNSFGEFSSILKASSTVPLASVGEKANEQIWECTYNFQNVWLLKPLTELVQKSEHSLKTNKLLCDNFSVGHL